MEEESQIGRMMLCARALDSKMRDLTTRYMEIGQEEDCPGCRQTGSYQKEDAEACNRNDATPGDQHERTAHALSLIHI